VRFEQCLPAFFPAYDPTTECLDYGHLSYLSEMSGSCVVHEDCCLLECETSLVYTDVLTFGRNLLDYLTSVLLTVACVFIYVAVCYHTVQFSCRCLSFNP